MKRMSHPKTVSAILLLSLTLLAAVCLFRTPYGFDWSDEAYYTALPYRYAIGDTLFSDGWEIHQLSVMFTIPLVRLFLLCTGGDTVGIMLYMRLLFVVFQYVTALFLFYSLRRRFGAAAAAVVSGMALLFAHFGLPNFSYDAFVILFTFWSLGFLVRSLDGRSPRGNASLAGLFYAFAVQSYPQYVVSFPFFLLFLFLLQRYNGEETKKNCRPLLFLAGIAAAVAIFLLFVATRSSFSALLENLPYLLSDPAHEAQGVLPLIKEYAGVILAIFGAPLSLALLTAAAALYTNLFLKDAARERARLPLLLAAALTALLLTLRVLCYDAYPYAKLNFLCMPLAFVSPAVLLLLPRGERPLPALLFALGVSLSLGVQLLSSNMGVYASSFPLLIASAGTVLGAARCLETSERSRMRLIARAACLCCAGLLLAGFSYCRIAALYRTDGTLSGQTARLDAGPAAGICVTPESKQKYDEVLRDIDAYGGTGPVLFARCLPFGYLCTTNIGTPSVWSVSPNTERVQEYYRLHPEHIPETIFLMDLDVGFSNVTRGLEKLLASFPAGYDYACETGESCLIYRRIS